MLVAQGAAFLINIKISFVSPAGQMLQGVLMKADVEGEVRIKCYMPSCSGESTQLDPPFINITLIYPLFTL